ncbi:hypothetical protein EV714DRAFT_284200 [Schizophyllum commune]
MPPTHATELGCMLQVFLDIIEERSGTLSPRFALAELQSALARGHLFSAFSQGPPEWRPGMRPLRLDRSATKSTCDELNLYGCAQVGAIKDRGLISLFGGLVIYTRLVMETQQLASCIMEHRLDVYMTDFWVNLPRYVVDPSGGTAARAMECMYTLFRCLRAARMPVRIGELLIERTREHPRRLCRTVAYYAEVIQTKEYSKSSDNLYEMACYFMAEVPEPVPPTAPDDLIRSLVAAVVRAAEAKAWKIPMGAGFFLQHIWTRTLTHRASYEISIRAGVFDILVDLCHQVPLSERALPSPHAIKNDMLHSKSQRGSGRRSGSVAKYVVGARAVAGNIPVP